MASDPLAVVRQQQVPLESLLGDYFIGAPVVWSAIHDAAGDADAPLLWQLSTACLRRWRSSGAPW
jgi:hypothetical protein